MDVNKPYAVKGLISYRYKGRYGYVFIGAKNDHDALREAKRSIEYEPSLEFLEVWTGDKYEPCECIS